MNSTSGHGKDRLANMVGVGLVFAKICFSFESGYTMPRATSTFLSCTQELRFQDFPHSILGVNEN